MDGRHARPVWSDFDSRPSGIVDRRNGRDADFEKKKKMHSSRCRRQNISIVDPTSGRRANGIRVSIVGSSKPHPLSQRFRVRVSVIQRSLLERSVRNWIVMPGLSRFGRSQHAVPSRDVSRKAMARQRSQRLTTGRDG
jgi:hypothetical protein